MDLKLTLAKATLVSATVFIMTVPAFAGNGNGGNDPGDVTGSGTGAFIISNWMESPLLLARGNGPGDGTGNGPGTGDCPNACWFEPSHVLPKRLKAFPFQHVLNDHSACRYFSVFPGS